jgi:hypothetical protein
VSEQEFFYTALALVLAFILYGVAYTHGHKDATKRLMRMRRASDREW